MDQYKKIMDSLEKLEKKPLALYIHIPFCARKCAYCDFLSFPSTDEKERALAIKLLQFEEAIQIVAKDGTPHVLCTYLYELAGVFSSFYEHCPILNNEDQQVKLSRLKLALLTERTLKQGLGLLGIKTVEKM